MSDLPLTSAQQGLFLAHQIAPENPCYTTAEVVDLDGPVDIDRWHAAHAAAYAEFEQTRVTFVLTPDGARQRVRPVAEVAAPRPVVVDVADDAEADAWMRADLARPMRLVAARDVPAHADPAQHGVSVAEPLVRSALLRLADGRTRWYHAAHHTVLDGYGAQQLLRRIAEHYAGCGPAEVAAPGVAALVAEDEDPPSAAARAFWEERLATMAGVVAVAGRTAAPAPAALRRSVEVDAGVQQAVVDGARRLGCGWTDLVIAAVGSYLARVAGQSSTRVGVPLMNRSLVGVGQLAAARTVCTAMNVLPVTVAGEGAVAAVVAATAAEQRAVRTHPRVRQEQLARRLDQLGGAQLFGAQVNLVPFDLELELGDGPDRVRGTVRNLTAGPVEDMTVTLRGTPGRRRAVRLELDASPLLYDDAELAGHLDRLLAWLVGFAAAAPDSEVADLPLATPDELDRIAAFNDTAVPRSPRTLGRRFVDQARTSPDAVALVQGEHQRTYAELHAAATALAGRLRAAGVAAGDVVGVRLERSFALYEAVHAIALLGAVYLPLDPDLPAARTAAMLEDAGCRTVLDAGCRTVLDAGAAGCDPGTGPEGLAGVRRISAGAGTSPPPSPPATEEIEPPDDADAAAYLLFTSGSTGRPKGVLVGHAAIDNRLRWMQERFRLEPGERVLHKTPISFDVSVWELYWPLQVGGCVVIADPGAHRDPARIADAVVTHEVALLHFVPSMLRAFLSDPTSRRRVADGAVRAVVCSGEALDSDLVRGTVAAFGVAPTNLYGPTEAAVDVTCWDPAPDAVGPVPIGRPLANTTCHVLDSRLRPQPIGVTGDLWLGGVQLAEGYVGRPDLTAERFVDVDLPGGRTRLYRTGDRAAWRADGALRYLGRDDDQVKLRGQRVELGEIEAALHGTPGVTALAAGLVDEPTRLVVWFQPETGGDAVADRLREALADRAAAVLPAAWVPTQWVSVPAIPVGTSGKTDRRTLRALTPALAGMSRAPGDAPRSLEEQRVCELVASVLGLPDGAVGADDDFFALGGDSLAVLRLVAALEADLDVRPSLADVFAQPTPARLTELTEELRAAGGTSAGTGLEELLTLRRASAAEGRGRPPLFLLPPAGGLGWAYTGLLRGLPADVAVHALQAPGIADGAPRMPVDLGGLAAAQLATIRGVVGDGPFHLAGWSLGGMAAHAVAAQARADGQGVGAVLLLDAYPSAQWAHLDEPDEQEALRGILRMGGVESCADPEVVLDREAVAEALRAAGSALAAIPPVALAGCIANVVAAAQVVRRSEHPLLQGDVDVVVATAPRTETWLDPRGWEPLTGGTVRLHPVASSHGDLVRRPAVDEVAAVLADLLDRH